MESFKVGDTVQVTGRFGNTKGTATVVKVLRTRVVLSNGDRYTLAGQKMDQDGRYGGRIGQTISVVSE